MMSAFPLSSLLLRVSFSKDVSSARDVPALILNWQVSISTHHQLNAKDHVQRALPPVADRQSLMEEGIKCDTPTVMQKHRLKNLVSFLHLSGHTSPLTVILFVPQPESTIQV